jgi:glycerophosphoryl diester phosphodiesterase
MRCPENTLAAFEQALVDGADILETDLHRSKDGVFVCIHDATVDRTTNGNGAVAEMVIEELRELSAGKGQRDYNDERIPTLEELATMIPPDVALALELKSDAFLDARVAEQLIAELDQWNVRGRTTVISFSGPRLAAIKQAAPDIPIGRITTLSPWPRAGSELLGPFWPILIVNPLFVHVAHRRGQLVCPLDPTPDSRLWLYRLLHCDALITDDPATTLQEVRRIGWV